MTAADWQPIAAADGFFRCEACHRVFPKARSDEEAEAEAEQIWGVPNAARQPSMAVVCDDCWKRIVGAGAAEDRR